MKVVIFRMFVLILLVFFFGCASTSTKPLLFQHEKFGIVTTDHQALKEDGEMCANKSESEQLNKAEKSLSKASRIRDFIGRNPISSSLDVIAAREITFGLHDSVVECLRLKGWSIVN